MSKRLLAACLVPFLSIGAASAQIATSNEDGATGAYSDEIGSSFTSESRFGPRTALDDLRADVDRDREAEEKLRQRAARAAAASKADEKEAEMLVIEPYTPAPVEVEVEEEQIDE